jgi:hypothetical protein
MKLRIRGNSLRIRVSQTELEQISRDGVASDAIRFGADSALEYGIEVRGVAPLQARFTGTEVRVIVPESALAKWLAPDQIAISGEQSLASGETLKILVEKDFTCLAPREGEDDSDLFPNPALSAG